MDKPLVSSQRRGPVTLVTMDNPATMNAMDEEMGPALCRALEAVGSDSKARAVVLTGAGGNFTGGGNLQNAARHLRDNPGQGAGRVFGGYTVWVSRVLAAMVSLKVPLVAAVEGASSGAGLGWMLAADVVLAADDARLVPGFLAVGLAPGAGVSLNLPRLLGLQRSSAMLMRSRPFSAAAALELGLVDEVTPAGRVLETALQRAAELAQAPPGALAASKALLARASRQGLLSQAEKERGAVMAAADDPQFARRVRRFLVK